MQVNTCISSDTITSVARDVKKLKTQASEVGPTIAGKPTDLSFRLRLHDKSAVAAGVARKSLEYRLSGACQVNFVPDNGKNISILSFT